MTLRHINPGSAKSNALHFPLPAWHLLLVCSLLLLTGCFSHSHKAAPIDKPVSLVNLAHLDHLYGTTVMDGDTVGFIAIYADAPGYQWVEAAGEGIACVDDAARAAVVYLNEVRQSHKAAHLLKLHSLLNFLLKMQAPNGLYYNFIYADYSINKTRENSRPLPNWWAWRTLWAFSEAYPFFLETDPLFAAELDAAIQAALPHLDTLLQAYPQTEDVNGFVKPLWLPDGAADQTSVLLLGLTAYYQATANARVAGMIGMFAEGIMRMQIRQKGFFADGLLLSWEDNWHAWGNNQAQALIRAGMALRDTSMINSGLWEVKNFYPFLVREKFLRALQFSDSNGILSIVKTTKFEQIAYDIRPQVMAALAAYQATGEQEYAGQAAQIARWFFGDNPAGEWMYDPESGRCYDGITNITTINHNSGAESTIEALLTLQGIEKESVIEIDFITGKSK